ncbi:hypothetical protein [Actinospica sp.]|uniref:hypothetical protein n=1 Tax=Actinospica sp. TaxID=1872142 RepID=UPI002C4A7FA0|nr:hypothetical protein [Actinospica sp.]HWG24943.1 hypothetical protein [Actinospica sp.]
MRRPKLIALALCGAVPLVLAGCGSGTATTVAPGTTSRPSTPISTDTAACAAGRCEVRVSPPETISFKPGLDLTNLRVTSIKSGVVTLVTTSTYNGGDAGVSSNANVCSSNGTNAITTNDMEVGCTITNNGLSMRVVSVDGESAVLRLEPTS